ncbi:hypothetical protein FB446DRAFT_805713 [Lentinula raphanica]|nr:hypothetical protein FB446DRAFT_805713 [Lentinula raphanica]
MHLLSSALSISFILCFIVRSVDGIPVPADSGNRYRPIAPKPPVDGGSHGRAGGYYGHNQGFSQYGYGHGQESSHYGYNQESPDGYMGGSGHGPIAPDLSAPQGNAAIPHYPATELLPTITEHPTVLAIPEHSAAPPPAHLDYILTVETEGRALTDIAQYELSMLGEIILKDWDGVQYSVQKNYHIITANNADHPYLTYFTLEAAEGTRSLRCPHNNPCFGTCAPGNERNWVIESMVLENHLIPHIEVSYDLPQENWILVLGHMGVPTDIRWLLKFVGRHALIHWEGTPWRHPTFVNRDITADDPPFPYDTYNFQMAGSSSSTMHSCPSNDPCSGRFHGGEWFIESRIMGRIKIGGNPLHVQILEHGHTH